MSKFTWSSAKTDPDLFQNGQMIRTMVGRSSAAQKFVEALSERVDSKCGFRIACGRIIILCNSDEKVIAKVNEAFDDKDFMSKYLVKYSPETYDNGTYLEDYYGPKQILDYISSKGENLDDLVTGASTNKTFKEEKRNE